MDPSAALETMKKTGRISIEDEERERSENSSVAVPHLHFDVFTDIFSRLKVKPLIQYRTVSKLFLSLIHNPYFVKLHLSKTFSQSTKEDQTFIHINSEDLFQTHLSLSNFDPVAKTLVTYKRIELPFNNEYGYFRIVGSSNGLICFIDTFSSLRLGSLFLWNPVLGRFKVLPKPLSKHIIILAKLMIVGFAFVPEIADFKILLIMHDPHSYADRVVLVYTLGENCWRKINVVVPCYLPSSCGGDVFVNGSFHWMASDSGQDRIILLFDMSNEVFAEFGLPNNIDTSSKNPKLSASCRGDSLSLFIDRDDDGWEIWSMREYGVVESWVKQYYIVNSQIFYPLKLMTNGHILVEENTYSDKLGVFDPENQVWKDTDIGCPYKMGVQFGCSMFGYTEGLGLLNETDGV